MTTFVTQKITNESVYKKLEAIEQKLDEHLDLTKRRHDQVMRHIRFLWATVGTLSAACGVCFLFIIDKIV